MSSNGFAEACCWKGGCRAGKQDLKSLPRSFGGMTEASQLRDLARTCRIEAIAYARGQTAAALLQIAANCEARAKEVDCILPLRKA